MWSAWHQAAWDGVDCSQGASAEEHMEAQHPLFLALSRWGSSPHHRKVLARLFKQFQDWKDIRWGDTVWGGSLGMIELAVDKNLPYLFKRCKQKGLLPNDRTWNMALLHNESTPMIHLGLNFPQPATLPQDHPHVLAMKIAPQVQTLERDTQKSSGEGTARRL